jgi:F-type H+-transporting ATPase subunit delta
MIGQTYASALLQAAKERKLAVSDLDRMEGDFDRLGEILAESKDAHVVLLGPSTSPAEKIQVLDEFMKRLETSAMAREFLTLLVKKGRLEFLAEIRAAFTEMRLSEAGGVVVSLVSAEQLGEAEKEDIVSLLKKKFNRPVLLRASVDPRLVAGMKVTVAGVTYDGSLRAQLQRLRDRLVHGVE